MKKIFLLFVFISSSIFSQQGIFKDRSEDAFAELDGKLSLHFFDALTGAPIEDAVVLVENSGGYKTDENGVAFFSTETENGNLQIMFQHEDYYDSKFSIEMMAGTIFFNRFSVSPKMKVGNIRIILDWDDEPEDLDAHFIKNNAYHISFRNMRVANDGSAQLDRDDTDGYGPETITVNSVNQSSSYSFFIEDYTNRGNRNSTYLADSKASVKIFDKNRGLVKVINVPTDLIGDKWEVFKIVNGEVIY